MVVVVTNTGKVDGSPGVVEAAFQEKLDVGAATPAPDKRSELLRKAWTLPALPPGGKQEFRVPVRAAEKGTYAVAAQVTTGRQAGGPQADHLRRRHRLAEGGDGREADGDCGRAGAGEGHRDEQRERSPRHPPPLTLQYESGLEHDSGEAQATATVGILEAGESKVLTVPLTARKAGVYKVRAAARAGEAAGEAEGVVDARRMELTATVSGPERLAPGADGLYEIGVSNRGDAVVPNVTVRATGAGCPGGEAGERRRDHQRANLARCGGWATWPPARRRCSSSPPPASDCWTKARSR